MQDYQLLVLANILLELVSLIQYQNYNQIQNVIEFLHFCFRLFNICTYYYAVELPSHNTTHNANKQSNVAVIISTKYVFQVETKDNCAGSLNLTNDKLDKIKQK